MLANHEGLRNARNLYCESGELQFHFRFIKDAVLRLGGHPSKRGFEGQKPELRLPGL